MLISRSHFKECSTLNTKLLLILLNKILVLKNFRFIEESIIDFAIVATILSIKSI